MSRFQDYKNKYATIRMERSQSGILQMTFSDPDGGPFRGNVHNPGEQDYSFAFTDVAGDEGNQVVIMDFPFAERHTQPGASAQRDQYGLVSYSQQAPPAELVTRWGRTSWVGKNVLMRLLDIEAPVIATMSGHATLHAEVGLLADIVLSADDAIYREAHLHAGFVPGDGVHVVWPMILGPSRGRYALMTGKVFTAEEAHQIGFVHELWPKDKLLGRAQELAERLIQKSPLSRRYARVVLTQRFKKEMLELLGYGLALESLGTLDREFRREEERGKASGG